VRIISWNCKRAKADDPIWDYLLALSPDIALLQEVIGLPSRIADNFETLTARAITKQGKPQKFSTAVITRGSILGKISMSGSQQWINDEMQRYEGNIVACTLQFSGERAINVVSAYSPAWPIDSATRHGVDVSPFRLKLNKDLWLADLLRDCLRHSLRSRPTGTWIVGGDLNLSETFDSWRGGPRGNREYLDGMIDLGLTECLRTHQGCLVPTFRNPRGGKVAHQIDHLFVTGDLAARLKECAVGDAEHIFGNSLSDHLPIIADFSYELMRT